MKTPPEDVREIQQMAAEAAEGRLSLSTVVFFVAECIVRYRDPGLLTDVPERVAARVRQMIAAYKEDGQLISVHSAGEVDHSELARQLVEIVEGAERPT
jgi:hypothetical protein